MHRKPRRADVRETSYLTDGDSFPFQERTDLVGIKKGRKEGVSIERQGEERKR